MYQTQIDQDPKPQLNLGANPGNLRHAHNVGMSTCRGHAIRGVIPDRKGRDLDTSPQRPRENQTATCAFSPIVGVDGSDWDPYTPIHRRAAKAIGGLLLHLLTVDGLSPGDLGGISVCCWCSLTSESEKEKRGRRLLSLRIPVVGIVRRLLTRFESSHGFLRKRGVYMCASVMM